MDRPLTKEDEKEIRDMVTKIVASVSHLPREQQIKILHDLIDQIEREKEERLRNRLAQESPSLAQSSMASPDS